MGFTGLAAGGFGFAAGDCDGLGAAGGSLPRAMYSIDEKLIDGVLANSMP